MNDAPETRNLENTTQSMVESIRSRILVGGKLLVVAVIAGIVATILLLANLP